MADLTPLAEAVRGLLTTDRPITPAGVCYLLRGIDTPPDLTEAEAALFGLARRNLAVCKGTGEFGPEFVRPFLRHVCNTKAPGQALPFGRKAEPGKCPRCDELRAGAAPRQAPPAIRRAAERQADEDRQSAQMTAHFASDKHRSGGCGPVCTAFDW